MHVQEWLANTQAGEIMTREMVTFDRQDTLSRVSEILLENAISGAPVVSDGRCVGVVSASDLMAAEEQVTTSRQEFALSGFWEGGVSLPVKAYEDKLAAIRARIAPMADQPVERFMSTQLVTVPIETPLSDVIQKMLDRHIHRVIITDSQQQLLGLITTVDILQALMDAS